MNLAYIFLFLISSHSFANEIYQQTCHVIGEDDYVQYSIEKEATVQKGSEFLIKLTAFEDENCKIPYLQYNQYFHVLTLEDEKINLQSEKITYTALSEETTQALQIINYCGFSDWQNKQEKNVTGKKCDDFQQLNKKQILYQIFQSDLNQVQIGQITNEKSGRTEQERPTTYDLKFTKIFAKPSLNINRITLK